MHGSNMPMDDPRRQLRGQCGKAQDNYSVPKIYILWPFVLQLSLLMYADGSRVLAATWGVGLRAAGAEDQGGAGRKDRPAEALGGGLPAE